MKKTDMLPNVENLEKTIKNDVLNRNDKLFNIIKLLNCINENFIISIDGDWGCGKTFLVKQLIYLYKKYEQMEFISINKRKQIKDFSSKYFVVYYNAWENDDHDYPLDSIIYKVLNDYPEYRENLLDENWGILKSLLMNFVEKSSLGIIKKEDLKELKSYGDLTKKINTHEEKKEAFQKLIDLLIPSEKRLLLIVDELDRCKPDYAVKTLETLKHFYDNKNITIIVSTNNNQLSHTICHFYGESFDGYGYLNKIYDTVITLTNDNKEDYVKKYFNFYSKTLLPENMSVFLFDYFNFSYREINEYISMYRIVEPYINYRDEFYRRNSMAESCIFLPLCLVLKIKNIELFNKFIHGNATELIMEVFSSSNFVNNKYVSKNWISEIFELGNDQILENEILKSYSSIFNNKDSVMKYPFMEAISMLGNLISVDE